MDLIEEDDQKKDFLSSRNGFKIEVCYMDIAPLISNSFPSQEQRQFLDLIPSSVGSGYAGIATGRVLNTKNVASSSSRQSSGQLWDRVVQDAGSSSSVRTPVPTPRQPLSFPPLQLAITSASTSASAMRSYSNSVKMLIELPPGPQVLLRLLVHGHHLPYQDLEPI